MGKFVLRREVRTYAVYNTRYYEIRVSSCRDNVIRVALPRLV